jgi:hypothetical protein
MAPVSRPLGRSPAEMGTVMLNEQAAARFRVALARAAIEEAMLRVRMAELRAEDAWRRYELARSFVRLGGRVMRGAEPVEERKPFSIDVCPHFPVHNPAADEDRARPLTIPMSRA